MAISNRERQKQFRDGKISSGESRLHCWLPEDDNERLGKLMDMLGYSGRGKKQQGCSEVISMALKELEISLTPAPNKNLVRYGLRVLEAQAISR